MMLKNEVSVTNMLTLKVKPWSGNPHSKRAMECDNECSICGRPMNYHAGYAVNRIDGRYRDGEVMPQVPGQATFGPVDKNNIGREPAEWATCVGSHCAKRLPKEYRFTMDMLTREYSKNQY